MDHDLLIFGAGLFARQVAKALQKRGHTIHAFLTSRESNHASIDGIPVISLSGLADNIRLKRPIICGVFNRDHAYQGIQDILHGHGLGPIIWPWEFYPSLNEELGWRYWLDPEPRSPKEWQDDHSYQTVMASLHDEESRMTLERLIQFRCGHDLAFSRYRSKDEQYFNRLTFGSLPLDQPICYLDLGAYHGDSLERLCSLREVGEAVLLEPDQDNFCHMTAKVEQLCNTCQTLRPLLIPLAAGKSHGMIPMSGQGESVSSMATGSQAVSLDFCATMAPLDHLLPTGRFDLIKIDVEGADLEAIHGMRRIIERSTAAIAVSIYHRPHDLTSIPMEMMSILKNRPYAFYMRQHMNNSFDTVFYAIPKA